MTFKKIKKDKKKKKLKIKFYKKIKSQNKINP